jgi:3-isopropylmalate/(R)-2-methylmalate dehydratase small subunit
MKDAEKGANARMTVDLEAQEITTSDGDVIKFEVDSFKKQCLLEGLDDIGQTLQKQSAVQTYEGKMAQERPWV